MSDAIGRVRSLSGSATIVRNDGQIVQVAAGVTVSRGDIIETGADGRIGITFADGTLLNLSSRGRMELEEFVCGPDGVLRSALLNLKHGAFGVVSGRAARKGRLRISTPFGTIQGDAQSGLIGVLTLVTLTLLLLQEAEASPNGDFAFVLDDIVNYKDLEHGTFEIVTKEAVPRVITVDDPEVTLVIRTTPAGFNIQQVANTSADMAALLAASHDANATYLAGQACTICYEGCAESQKAISLTPFSQPDGRTILEPSVDSERCVGCGRCEHRCPASPGRGIRVLKLTPSPRT
jgi:Pyruvate/2-oxoacid:ferredoxin oxidoreductase delta subunit